MKKLVFLVALVGLFSLTLLSTSSAQNFLSKPTAKENLIDEYKYLNNLIDGQTLSDENALVIAVQKRRLIRTMLLEMNKGAELEHIAAFCLPHADVNKLQPGMAKFKVPTQGKENQRAWMRSEIMKLITY